jgi:hypothetical protein
MNIPDHNLVADFRRSGKTQQDYCTAHNVSIHTLRYHLYKRSRRKVPSTSQLQRPGSIAVAAPSFISFSRETIPENTSYRHFTVIHGTFSVTELVEFISMATTRP